MEKKFEVLFFLKTATLFVRDEFMIIFVPPVIAICMGIHMIWWVASVM